MVNLYGFLAEGSGCLFLKDLCLFKHETFVVYGTTLKSNYVKLTAQRSQEDNLVPRFFGPLP